jgi:long-chain fatty acid transport protein
MRILLAAALLAPAAAFANGYHLPTPNPRDLAMGGSTTASAQDSAAAVFGNPAALAGLPGLNIDGALELITLTSHWEDPNHSGLSPVDTTPKATFPPALYVSYGDKIAGRPFGVGVGLTFSGGGLEFWPNTWPGKASIISVDRRNAAFDLAAGFQPIDMFKVGLGVTYMRSSEKLVQDLPFLNSDGDAQLSTSGGGFSFAVGGELTPLPGLRIGVDYRHKVTQEMKGDAHFGHVPDTFSNILRDQGATHKLTFPNVLQAGASYQVTPDLLVSAGYLLVRWVVYTNDLFVGDQGLTVNVPHDYRNGWGLSLGAEYKLPLASLSGLVVRAGLERVSSPQPTDTLHPAIPDANSTSYSVGLGYHASEKMDVNVGYKLAILDTITTTGPEAFPGQYNTTAHFVSAGIVYRFGGFGSAAK